MQYAVIDSSRIHPSAGKNTMQASMAIMQLTNNCSATFHMLHQVNKNDQRSTMPLMQPWHANACMQQHEHYIIMMHT
jgi:hypothetical protein